MEKWKSVVGYEGLYEVSDLGNIKSVYYSNKVLKQGVGTSGYKFVNLYKDKKRSAKMIHQLVAISFLNHKPCGQFITVDHINGVKTDNRVCNLQLLTIRANTNKSVKIGGSGYRGVVWNEQNKKWQVRPRLAGVKMNVGYFDDPKEAHECYLGLTEYIKDINTKGKTREELKDIIEEYKQKVKQLK